LPWFPSPRMARTENGLPRMHLRAQAFLPACRQVHERTQPAVQHRSPEAKTGISSSESVTKWANIVCARPARRSKGRFRLPQTSLPKEVFHPHEPAPANPPQSDTAALGLVHFHRFPFAIDPFPLGGTKNVGMRATPGTNTGTEILRTLRRTMVASVGQRPRLLRKLHGATPGIFAGRTIPAAPTLPAPRG